MSGHTGSAEPRSHGCGSLWRNRTFLRFFVGQFVTNAGDSLYAVAALWLVFERSGSTFLTGVASFLLLLPYLLQMVAGPIVDRFPIKLVLVGSQVGQGALVLVLPLAAYTGHLTVWLVLVTLPVLSLLTLIAAPVPAALMPRIVAEERLSQGNSALTTITHGLDMIFDALGGLFIAVFGATTLFVLDSVTFAVAALLFAGMGVPSVDDEDPGFEESPLSEYLEDLRDGVAVLRGTVFVDMMLASAAFNLALGVTLAILPAFGEVLGGPAVYGLLLGALGTGRVVGSAVASPLERIPYGRLKATTYLLSALLWVGAVFAPSVALTVGLFGLAWVSAGVDAVLIATMNQKVFPATLLGRVSSIKGSVSLATLPFGSLVGGFVAELLGTTTTMGLAAFGFGVAGLYFAVHPSLRRLPAIVDVDQSTFGVDVEGPPAATTGDGE